MKSVSIEGLMMSIDYLQSIEKENIIEAYNAGRYDEFLDGEDYYNETHNK